MNYLVIVISLKAHSFVQCYAIGMPECAQRQVQRLKNPPKIPDVSAKASLHHGELFKIWLVNANQAGVDNIIWVDW